MPNTRGACSHYSGCTPQGAMRVRSVAQADPLDAAGLGLSVVNPHADDVAPFVALDGLAQIGRGFHRLALNIENDVGPAVVRGGHLAIGRAAGRNAGHEQTPLVRSKIELAHALLVQRLDGQAQKVDGRGCGLIASRVVLAVLGSCRDLARSRYLLQSDFVGLPDPAFPGHLDLHFLSWLPEADLLLQLTH